MCIMIPSNKEPEFANGFFSYLFVILIDLLQEPEYTEIPCQSLFLNKKEALEDDEVGKADASETYNPSNTEM
ncbi:26825_t:CDS:2 [Dentiscutata erythropus]|uniref:26825_t:CDS:1 n=1 Tax=Dentiscutata erythropus TaxID=1348616 RepID=A0A9N9G593_9GLOM|nr:26825_t:CDS:2 [Dentiscutata erythropus]